MNKKLLQKHLNAFKKKYEQNIDKFQDQWKERKELIVYYQSFTSDKILSMDEDTLYEYISKLWAMLIWGNKHYVVDKIIEKNKFKHFKEQLAELVWSSADIAERWNTFHKDVNGMGPAMMSEILCKAHPDKYILWNRRAYVGLQYLGVDKLPRYDYQLTGKMYKYLCEVGLSIAEEMQKAGFQDKSLLAVDYFIWEELQVADNLTKMNIPESMDVEKTPGGEKINPEFVHNDVRDKLQDIGEWLGFSASTEKKVSAGSKVDTLWEATIGNMGRVMYVFEVQTKGSIDSLILNLLKSLNNPAVQGIVAVSDRQQLEKIKKHVADVKELNDKLKYWDYEEVLKVHESLEFTNSCINKLGLVPEGF